MGHLYDWSQGTLFSKVASEAPPPPHPFQGGGGRSGGGGASGTW
jgi:uncharacterized membrane protein YgcG